MKKITLLFIIFILHGVPLQAGLLINEIACATAGDDWVELFFHSESNEGLDIHNLYVTMYYGTNEALSSESITIYSYDRPETPYDDRFVIVHLTEANIDDETDRTGDTNSNGNIDIYCSNYSNSLWNTDCVVAIDTDDDPANGGIIDFAAYSSRDGTVNETMKSYVENAQSFNEWQGYSGENIQECMIDTGNDGLSSYMSISRKNASDSNTADNFGVTKYMTPGRMNIFSSVIFSKNKIFRVSKKKITAIPSHPTLGTCNIDVFVFEQCNIRFRIFSSIGMLIFESPLYTNINPGFFELNWNLRGLGKKARTGLYLAYIEATSSALKNSDVEKIYIILSRYR